MLRSVLSQESFTLESILEALILNNLISDLF